MGWYCLQWDLIWFDLIWFDLIWFDLIWYDLIWFDLWDMIWWDEIWYTKSSYRVDPCILLIDGYDCTSSRQEERDFCNFITTLAWLKLEYANQSYKIWFLHRHLKDSWIWDKTFSRLIIAHNDTKNTNWRKNETNADRHIQFSIYS